jgi:single-stranded DNA-binding protein
MASLEIVIVTGRIGRDAEERAFGDRIVMSTSIAVDVYKGQGQKDTAWRKISIWFKTTDSEQIALHRRMMRKGAIVQVKSERVTASAYTDKNGNTVAVIEYTFFSGGLNVLVWPSDDGHFQSGYQKTSKVYSGSEYKKGGDMKGKKPEPAAADNSSTAENDIPF